MNFIILDAAQKNVSIPEIQFEHLRHQSLYHGMFDTELENYSPFLCEFDSESNFARFFFEEGWGNSWAIMINSAASYDELYKHFKKFVLVKTESNRELLFRYYDPRVLRMFLPTASALQLSEFFGPVKQFIAEDTNTGFGIKYWLENSALKHERFEISRWRNDLGSSTPQQAAIPITKKPNQQTGSGQNNPWM